jgi:hypothetical protein
MPEKSLRTAALLLVGATLPAACDLGTDPEPAIPASIELLSEVDVLPAGQTTRLRATVLDEDGDTIDAPDITFGSSSSSIATVDTAGIVTGVGDGQAVITATAGAHSDTVELFVFRAADLCAIGLRLTAGEPVRASLQEGDCVEIFSDSSFTDIWFFDLEQQAAITLELTSQAFDAYLLLLDNDNNVIAEDDDSAGGTDARIEATLEAGRYWILANQIPPEGAPQPEGAYTLSLTSSTTTASTAAGPLALDARTQLRPVSGGRLIRSR